MMNLKNYLNVAAACLALASCNTGKQSAGLTTGIDLANLDTTAQPGTDFYQYACGGWMVNHPLTTAGIEKFRLDYEAVFGKA